MNKTCIAIVLAARVLAQQPHVQNAKLETRAASGGLDAAFRAILSTQAEPAWVGYAAPMIRGRQQMCCWSDNERGCFLEPNHGGNISNSATQTVQLEGSADVVVLYRIENHEIQKIRNFTPECTLDAGGRPFIWLNGVTPADSIAYLFSFAHTQAAGTAREQSRRANGAVAAIAFHADAAADRALDQLADASLTEQVRLQAIFWMGAARGKAGFESVSRILQADPNEKIRERSVFALTQNKEPGALDAVVRAAHDDKSARVRGQALFWLAQRAAEKTAQAAITDAIANDPETQVKKRAVFALTQMPNGEGVPLLIQLARTNSNPVVRKQAMFWLGQSKDARALAYIEEVLK
ncbi:MAG TPA: HEAT repeat domain-containing protein [Bryobacteraceae bacterium]|nr:HEAT repeat domain-containing protein [Bryobacteraceae bacterium]